MSSTIRITALEQSAQMALTATRTSPVPRLRASKGAGSSDATASAVVESGRSDGVPDTGPLKDQSSPVTKEKVPRKRKAKVVEPIIYVIPPVERLTTSFKGRLGYACLNTILRNELKPSVFCSRTCRIDTIKKEGMEFLKELGRKNIIDLTKLIHWNVQNKIFFLRMSSEIFPFASHPDLGYTLEYASEELKLAGDTAKRLGVRLTTHPGQFTQLGSPRESVLSNAARDLKYHCELMDRMGLDQDSVMILHGGGVYGDKAAAMERFRANFRLLPLNVRNRVVLENDEMCYNVDDLLPVCEELEIPLVLDYHHDWIYPSSQTPTEMMPRILATWKRGIKPKQHLSEPRFGAVTTMEKRAHSDRCQRLPEGLPDDMDLMIEAKDKEQAVLHLFRIYNLQPTIHESLRPPVLQETTQTAGRKSNKRKAASQAQPLIKTDDAEFVDEVEGEGLTTLKIKRTRTSKKEVSYFEDVGEGEGLDEAAVSVSVPTKRRGPSRKSTGASAAPV